MILLKIIFYISFSTLSHGADSCFELFQIEKVVQTSKYSAERVDKFSGTQLEKYSPEIRLYLSFATFDTDGIAYLGHIEKKALSRDLLVAKKTSAGVFLFVKRSYDSISDARNEFERMIERETLANAGHFGSIRVPRAISYDGSSIFFEYVEGTILKDAILRSEPLQQAKLLERYTNLIEEVYSLHDHSARFEIFEFAEPRVVPAIAKWGTHPSELDVAGNLILVDASKPPFSRSPFRKFGRDVLYLEPDQILVSRDGDFYYIMDSVGYYSD